jgi:hypothetical protein
MSKLHLQRLHDRPLSWSSISLWYYDKQQWARKYLDGLETPPNSEMLFGNVIGQKIASDPSFLPEITPRYKIYEKAFNTSIDNGRIRLVSYLDNYCPDTHHFHEFKTSSNPKKWTQLSAEEHGQLDFYYLMIWLCEGVLPEDVKARLWYIPVEKGADFEMKLSASPIQSFPIQKTVVDILKFGNYIIKTYRDMEKFAKKYKGGVKDA